MITVTLYGKDTEAEGEERQIQIKFKNKDGNELSASFRIFEIPYFPVIHVVRDNGIAVWVSEKIPEKKGGE
jgi:hypothetical protein